MEIKVTGFIKDEDSYLSETMFRFKDINLGLYALDGYRLDRVRLEITIDREDDIIDLKNQLAKNGNFLDKWLDIIKPTLTD